MSPKHRTDAYGAPEMSAINRARTSRRSIEIVLIAIAVAATIAVGVGATVYAYSVRVTDLAAMPPPPVDHAATKPAPR